MLRKTIWLLTFLSVTIVGIISFRPIPIPHSEDELILHTAELDSLLSTDSQDIVIFLKNSEKTFYINRGLEYSKGIKLWEMRDSLKGKTIEIGYPEYWTILDPNYSTRHASVLKYQGRTLYSEIKEVEVSDI